jgi:uncharacterized protein YdeI (YjbR/CyaY-like superfamily)
VGTKDRRIDTYISAAAPFAKPILKLLRKLVHAACPDVSETIKWGHPSFDYKGPLAGMAAFKHHCTFGFWKHGLVEKRLGLKPAERGAWGTFGRITSVKDLPSERALMRYVKAAAELNDQGVKVPRKVRPAADKIVDVPEDLLAALIRNPKARDAFDGMSYSHKKEYVQWITEAKADATRERRIATAVEWMAEGKSRNWKYERKK